LLIQGFLYPCLLVEGFLGNVVYTVHWCRTVPKKFSTSTYYCRTVHKEPFYIVLYNIKWLTNIKCPKEPFCTINIIESLTKNHSSLLNIQHERFHCRINGSHKLHYITNHPKNFEGVATCHEQHHKNTMKKKKTTIYQHNRTTGTTTT